MNYPGGKGNCYQHIINLMPPHKIYIETHIGGGSVFENKKPSMSTIGIDADAAVIEYWKNKNLPAATFINGDARSEINKIELKGEELIYADPPYMMSTRKGGRLYKHEYTDDDHIDLLNVLKKAQCPVIISGYRSSLYMESLQGWEYKEFQSQTRQGTVTESVWYNFKEAGKKADYSHIGDNFRERERVKRKRKRWLKNFKKLPPAERWAIYEELRSTIVKCDDKVPNS